MFFSLLKFLLPLAILNTIGARVLQPKFYGQDSAIIVDTDKSLQSKLNPKLQNALYYNIPVYKLFKPTNQFPAPTTTTTTTAAPFGEAEQYPSDLLHIARNKLGLKRLDQLPSIRELGELLGTGNAEDTIKYIRALTSNDQGIALMKAYLGSLDYEQSEPEIEQEQDDSEDDNDMDNADIDADYDNAMPLKQPKLESTTKPTQWDESGGLMQRVNEFMKQYGMWADETTTTTTTTTTAKPMIYRPMFVAPQTQLATTPTVNVPRLVHVRQPLPYHYPIPLRAAVKPTPTMVPSTTAAPTPPHLNSPKVLPIESAAAVTASGVKVAPHIRQLADMANIPPSVLDTFLQQQPKLAELAKRVSRLPLVQQHNRAIDGQLLVAVKKALSQDENLQRLLNASQTLK